MKKYFSSDEAWEKKRSFYQDGPSPEWQALYDAILGALELDPASNRSQALADRYLQLSIRAQNGEPGLQLGSFTAWLDRENWPPSLKQRLNVPAAGQVHKFIGAAAVASRKKYFGDVVWGRLNLENFGRYWQERVDLFRDIEATMNEDPAGPAARPLAARWSAHLDTLSDGDRM